MEKSLFLTAALSCATTLAFAQLQSPTEQKVNVSAKFQKMQKVELASNSRQTVKSLKKSAATGLYYNRPLGSIFNGVNEEGSYVPTTSLVIPPFTTFEFENVSTNPSATSWTSSDGTDYSDYVDPATGNILMYVGTYTRTFYRFPVLSNGSDSYKMGAEAGNPDAEAYYSEYSGYMVDSIGAHSFVDINNTQGAWGALDTKYLYGTGKITFEEDGSTWTSTGVAQFCPKPMAPLYIEDFNFVCYSGSRQPLTGDAQLKLTIYNVVEENGSKEIGDEVLGEMTATVESQSLLGGPYTTDYTASKQCYIYNINFANYSENAFGEPVKVPVTLDQEFVVVISGCDGDGVDVGFLGYLETDEDKLNANAVPMLTNGTESASFSYVNDIVLSMSFTGGFDYVDVADYTDNNTNEPISDTNVLRFDADGNCLGNVGLNAAGETDADYVTVYTAFEWYDSEENENYSSSSLDLGDWLFVDGQDVTTTQNVSGSMTELRTGAARLTFMCDPLESGQTKRAASIYFQGKGYTAATPVIILQGDATIADAIENPIVVSKDNDANAPVYNLNGQRVAKNTKGILIQNGKKFINK